MPNYHMMVGVPASGKSTLVEKLRSAGAKVVSSDAIIEGIAKGAETTYDDVFDHSIKYAGTLSKHMAAKHFKAGQDVVSDQTNLSKKSRAPKLAMVPKNYKKIAINVNTPPHEEHMKRLSSRPGKTIPEHVMKNFTASYQEPTHDEGFDEIHHYDHNGNMLKVSKAINPKKS